MKFSYFGCRTCQNRRISLNTWLNCLAFSSKAVFYILMFKIAGWTALPGNIASPDRGEAKHALSTLQSMACLYTCCHKSIIFKLCEKQSMALTASFTHYACPYILGWVKLSQCLVHTNYQYYHQYRHHKGKNCSLFSWHPTAGEDIEKRWNQQHFLVIGLLYVS